MTNPKSISLLTVPEEYQEDWIKVEFPIWVLAFIPAKSRPFI